MKYYKLILALIMLFTIGLCNVILAQQTKVIKCPNTQQSLEARWKWADQEAKNFNDGS